MKGPAAASDPLTPQQQAAANKLYLGVRELQRSGVTMILLSAPPDGTLKLRPVGRALDVLEEHGSIVSTNQ